MYIPDARFYLKDTKAVIPTLISVQIKFNGHRVFMSTGEKIIPSNWDFIKQRAIGKANYDLNFWLDKIEAEAKTIFRNLNIENITPTGELVQELLKEKIDNTPQNISIQSEQISFFEFINQFIEQAKTIRKHETIKAYKSTLNHLKDYCHYYNKKLDFDNVDMDFYHSFTKYLSIDIGNSKNTVAKHIKTIKTFMNEATDRGVNSNLVFRTKSFKKITEPVDKIYLSTDEIKSISELDLSETKVKDYARDLFVVSCYTGLRFSDLNRLTKDDIQGSEIKIQTQKTGQCVVIPINTIVRRVLEKHKYSLPTISNVKMNQYLKDIGKMAGIDSVVVISKTEGGRRVQKSFKKYELITAHSGRRSFATNAYKSNIPAISIMKITGHTSEKVFLGYIRISQEENAQLLMKHDFFQ